MSGIQTSTAGLSPAGASSRPASPASAPWAFSGIRSRCCASLTARRAASAVACRTVTGTGSKIDCSCLSGSLVPSGAGRNPAGGSSRNPCARSDPGAATGWCCSSQEEKSSLMARCDRLGLRSNSAFRSSTAVTVCVPVCGAGGASTSSAWNCSTWARKTCHGRHPRCPSQPIRAGPVIRSRRAVQTSSTHWPSSSSSRTPSGTGEPAAGSCRGTGAFHGQESKGATVPAAPGVNHGIKDRRSWSKYADASEFRRHGQSSVTAAGRVSFGVTCSRTASSSQGWIEPPPAQGSAHNSPNTGSLPAGWGGAYVTSTTQNRPGRTVSWPRSRVTVTPLRSGCPDGSKASPGFTCSWEPLTDSSNP